MEIKLSFHTEIGWGKLSRLQIRLVRSCVRRLLCMIAALIKNETSRRAMTLKQKKGGGAYYNS